MIRRIPSSDAPPWLTPPLDERRTASDAQARERATNARAMRAALAKVEHELTANVEAALRELAISRVTAADLESLLTTELAKLRRASVIRVHVSPENASALELSALRAASELSGELELVSDPSITRGGARLESPLGDVDATLETRLALVLAAWLASAREAP